jgi:hypothetical protein
MLFVVSLAAKFLHKYKYKYLTVAEGRRKLSCFTGLRIVAESKFTKILRSAHTVYLCVLCGSENKQRLFHCTALTDWFL